MRQGASLDRHPWRLELENGTVVTEHEDGRERNYPGIFDRRDIRVFSFATPVGEIGVNHSTGFFFALGHMLMHPDYRLDEAGSYRHWHRVNRFQDFGARIANGILGYCVGMERMRAQDGAREVLFIQFRPGLSRIEGVKVWKRVVFPGDGRPDQEIELAWMQGWTKARTARGGLVT